MEKLNLNQVIRGYQDITAGLPQENKDLDSIFEKTWDLFSATMLKILPLSFFVLCKAENVKQVIIFDSNEKCEKWIASVHETVSCKKIDFQEFMRLTEMPWKRWEDINAFNVELEDCVIIEL